MIIGLGIDLVEISRIHRSLERFGDHFLQKVLHPEELADMPGVKDLLSLPFAARIAARFAAKEAGVKALGTGFTQGIGLHDLRVHSLASGKPLLAFHNKAGVEAAAQGVLRIHLSLTHGRDTAGAVVVLESR